MVKKIANKFPLAEDFIIRNAQGSTNIFKQHILKALMECGYTTEIFGDLHKKLFTKASPLNVSMDPTYPDPAEIIEAIHEAGGIAVLAHPGFYDNFELFEELIPLGLDGVEVWHPENTPEQQEALIKTAKKHGLLMTGGSDFHGGFNAYPLKIGEYGPTEEALSQLLSYKAKKRRKRKAPAAEK